MSAKKKTKELTAKTVLEGKELKNFLSGEVSVQQEHVIRKKSRRFDLALIIFTQVILNILLAGLAFPVIMDISIVEGLFFGQSLHQIGPHIGVFLALAVFFSGLVWLRFTPDE